MARGRSYKRRVNDLRMTEDGGLVAWVHGSDRYATQVQMCGAGRLSHECTCPYGWGPCKHAVAVVLAYLDAVKKKQEVPLAQPNDKRLLRIDDESSGGYREDGGAEEWDVEDLHKEGGTRMMTRRRQRSTDARRERHDRELQQYLDGLPRESLMDLAQKLTDDYPETREKVLDQARLQDGRVARMVASIRREIENLAREPAWSNHWSGEGHVPDYSRVRKRLKTLLEGGHADEVVSLGEDLLQLGTRQIEMSHDEGETGMEINSSAAVVFRAVTSSSMSPSEQLLWEINAHLGDDYSLLDGLEGPLSRNRYCAKDWDTVAHVLGERLAEMPTTERSQDRASFHRDYQRQQLMQWLIHSLDKAGRKEEVVPLLEREAPVTDCYVDLVDRLISTRRRKDAEKWARKGFEKTIGRFEGIAWALEERLRKLAERKKDLPLVVSWRATEFFHRPDIPRYAALEKAARAAGVWADVRACALQYLETGIHPDVQPKMKTPGRGSKGADTGPLSLRPVLVPALWPLPATGLRLAPEDKRSRTFPHADMLMDIAIREKRSEDVLKWHEQAGKQAGFWGNGHDDKVATAIQMTHPDVALSLWKRLVEANVAQVKPASYRVAGGYLRKMRGVYAREKRLAGWRDYLAKLRAQNKRRPRMLEVLDSLDRKRRRILRDAGR